MASLLNDVNETRVTLNDLTEKKDNLYGMRFFFIGYTIKPKPTFLSLPQFFKVALITKRTWLGWGST